MFQIWYFFRILKYLLMTLSGILKRGPKSKHEIYVCFIYALCTHPEDNFIPYFLIILCVKQSFMVEFSTYDIILILKMFQILEHLGFQIFLLAMLNLCNMLKRNRSKWILQKILVFSPCGFLSLGKHQIFVKMQNSLYHYFRMNFINETGSKKVLQSVFSSRNFIFIYAVLSFFIYVFLELDQNPI